MQAPGLPGSRVWLGGSCNKKAITQVFRAGHPFRVNGWPPPTLLLAMWTLPLPNFIPQCTGREQGAHGAVFVCFLKRGAHTPSANPAVPGRRPTRSFPQLLPQPCVRLSLPPMAPTQRTLSTPYISARGSPLLCSLLEHFRQKTRMLGSPPPVYRLPLLHSPCQVHPHSHQTLPTHPASPSPFPCPTQPSPSTPSGRALGSSSPSAR